MTALVQFATTDNAFFKPLEVPLPLKYSALLDAARKKFKNVTKQSKLYDGVSGSELRADAAEVELAAGAKIMVSGKAGWKGAERLHTEYTAERLRAQTVAEEPMAGAAMPAADGGPSSAASARAGTLPLRLQLVSFSYDLGEPHDTATSISARGLPNPAKATAGRTGLEKRLAKDVLASLGAAELCDQIIQEALLQIQRHYAAAAASDDDGSACAANAANANDHAAAPPLIRVGVGCDRGQHRSVAMAEAATARLVRKAEHARSGRNCPGLEALLRAVRLMDVDHRDLAEADRVGARGVDEDAGLPEDEEDGGRRAELRLVGGV